MVEIGDAATYAEIEEITVSLHDEVIRLADLSPVQYETERRGVATALNIALGRLDQLVKVERKATSGSDDKKQGRPLDLPECEPWEQPVDGNLLLDEVCHQIRRYVVLGEHDPIAVALWIIHAHALDCAEHSARLHLASPVKRCGKSTLLRVIEPMVPKALGVENITTAALFRAVESVQPTLLIDEADTFFSGKEELRGMINAGHGRNGTVVRTVGDDHEPRQFSVWCPTVIAGIGRLPGTIEDRSITILLHRRLSAEPVERLQTTRRQHLVVLGRKIARWVADNSHFLRDLDPELPGDLEDRAQDNWRPLIAIADTIGPGWGGRARQAAVAISGPQAEDDQSPGTQALADVCEVFEDRGAERLRSSDIVEALNALEDRPWPEFRRGQPLNASTLAKLLKPFGIAPENVRFGSSVGKGYRRNNIADAYGRYAAPRSAPTLPSSSSPDATPPHSNNSNSLGGDGTATRSATVAEAHAANALETNGSSVVADTPPVEAQPVQPRPGGIRRRPMPDPQCIPAAEDDILI